MRRVGDFQDLRLGDWAASVSKSRTINSAILPVLLLAAIGLAAAPAGASAVLYINEFCDHCIPEFPIINDALNATGHGPLEVRTYINNTSARAELRALHERLGVPLDMQGHLVVAVDGRYLFEGHVPGPVIKEFLQKSAPRYSSMVVLQDSMEGTPTAYRIMNDRGEIKECRITETVAGCDSRALALPAGAPLLALVAVTGLADGINPCAFAVLLFFIALLYTLKRLRSDILKIGGVYIGAIYLAYLLIGLGLFQAVTLPGFPTHFFAKFGGILVLALGVWNLKDWAWPGKGPTLRMVFRERVGILHRAEKATMPSAFGLGFLVGLCTFPCTGGIYVAVLGLLSVSTTALEGFGYLLLYNVMFVVPLIVILAVATRPALLKRAEAMASHSSKMKLWTGLFMVSLGLFLLFGGWV